MLLGLRCLNYPGFTVTSRRERKRVFVRWLYIRSAFTWCIPTFMSPAKNGRILRSIFWSNFRYVVSHVWDVESGNCLGRSQSICPRCMSNFLRLLPGAFSHLKGIERRVIRNQLTSGQAGVGCWRNQRPSRYCLWGPYSKPRVASSHSHWHR